MERGWATAATGASDTANAAARHSAVTAELQLIDIAALFVTEQLQLRFRYGLAHFVRLGLDKFNEHDHAAIAKAAEDNENEEQSEYSWHISIPPEWPLPSAGPSLAHIEENRK